MGAHESLGPQFHVEDDTLHVGGRPFPMARSLQMPDNMYAEGWRQFDVPFESGHELRLFGRFKESGGQMGSRHMSAAGVIHKPTAQYVNWEGTPVEPFGPGTEGLHIGSPEDFHDVIKRVGRFGGGSKSAT